MEQQLKETLREGETLLWAGKARDFKTLDATNKRSFVISALVCGGIFLALTALYALMARRSGAAFKPGIPLVLLVICAIHPSHTFTDARTLRRVGYAVTDRRLLILGRSPREMPLHRITAAALRQDADGQTSLLCGRLALSEPPSKWREIAAVDKPGTNPETAACQAFGFYAVDDPEGLRAALRRLLPALMD